MTDTRLTDWWEQRGDLAVTVVLTALTLLTAWAGFQSSKWSGVQAINFSEAGRARADSNALASIGTSNESVDVGLFVAWLEASQDVLADGGDPTSVLDGQGLPAYLYARFSEPLRVATDDWLAQGLASNNDEPSTPFDLDSYVNPALIRSEELRQEASDFGDAARSNNQQSDNYVLMTVLFASGMFLAGLCQKLGLPGAQMALFFVSACLLIFGTIVLFGEPIEFSEADLPW